MGMTAFYGGDPVKNEDASLDTFARAIALGINFFDTAWLYQTPSSNGLSIHYNEELVGKAIKIHGRENMVVATKFGIAFNADGMLISSKPDFIRQQLDESLKRLGTDYVDLYYQHRVDPNTPIEETFCCLKELVQEGKIKYIGMSECSASELRRAHTVHPVTAIQIEWSLNTRDIEEHIVPTARELGVGIVAYSS